MVATISITDWDINFSRRVHNLQIGFFEYLALFFGFIFNQYLIWLVPFFTSYQAKRSEYLAENFHAEPSIRESKDRLALVTVLLYLLSVIFTVICTQTTKKLFGRVRPTIVNTSQIFNLRRFEGNCSMPSGDTAQAANWGMFMVLYFGNPLYFLTWIPVAFSRTFFQCHWVSDTIIGALIGVAVSLVTYTNSELLVTLIIKALSSI